LPIADFQFDFGSAIVSSFHQRACQYGGQPLLDLKFENLKFQKFDPINNVSLSPKKVLDDTRPTERPALGVGNTPEQGRVSRRFILTNKP
jgi:hypothetical protein